MSASILPEPLVQHLSSIRYVAPAVCIIPTTDPDLWGVFVGAQASRNFIGLMSTEEMLAHHRQSWLETVTQYNTGKAAELVPRDQISTLELDDIIADLDF